MTIGTPKVWASADPLNVTNLTNELHDQYNALFNPPRGRLTVNGSDGNNIPTQAVGTLHNTLSGLISTFHIRNTTSYTGSMTTGVTSWNRLIAPIAGTYELSAGACFVDYDNSQTAGNRGALLVLNGTTIIDAAVSSPVISGAITGPSLAVNGKAGTTIPLSTEIVLAASDYVQLMFTQSSGTTFVLSSPADTFLEMLWVGN